MAEQATGTEQERAGDLTKIPFHIADLGSDTMEAELAASNSTRLSNELAAIDDALERLHRAPERFGICQDTGAWIPLARLDVIPWARTCRRHPAHLHHSRPTVTRSPRRPSP